jgi:hypothetical protein
MEIIKNSSTHLDTFLLNSFLNLYKNGIHDFLMPAGGTPESFYHLLNETSYNELEHSRLWQIDDILNGHSQGQFLNFFDKNLNSFRKNLIPIKDIEEGPARPFVSFLGLGVNGHVAFHEPHIDPGFSFGCVELGEETLNYLSLDKGTWGVTFGLGTFLKSEKIYLMVKGSHKSAIFTRFMNDDPTVPAVALKKHPGLVVLIDEAVSEAAA